MVQLHGRISKALTASFLAIILLASCTTVKNYPVRTPFVYANKVTLKGDISKDEKTRLDVELPNYWDDSLKVGSVTQLGVRTVIKNPPRYDSINISHSVDFMRSYLNSQGYYDAIITPVLPPKIDSSHINQYRVTVEMDIDVQKSLKIDSVSYDSITTPELRTFAEATRKESNLKKGNTFSKAAVSAELDRLVLLYRNNGYYKFTRDNLIAEADTTDIALLELTLDPFEQAQRIAEAAARRKANPTVNIIIKQRVSADTNAFSKYYVGRLFYYPQTLLNESPDTAMKRNLARKEPLDLRQHTNFMYMQPLRFHTYITKDSLYNEKNYFRTVNGFTQLGPWSQVDVRTVEHHDSLNVVDFHFFLTPYDKYHFGYDLELSRNAGVLSGNLLGVTNVFTLRDRNVWKSAIQASTNIRAGVELGFTDTLLQTIQLNASQTYSIPKLLLWPHANNYVHRYDDYKTLVNVSLGYTDRRSFYRLRSGLASFAWEWKKNNHIWLITPVNIELYSLDTLGGLLKAFEANPFLRTAFNTGYVVGPSATYNVTIPNRRNHNLVHNIRLSGEWAGAFLYPFRGLRDKVYQYVKLEGEYRFVYTRRNISHAFRFFGGVGINYSNDPVLSQSLPFFKQFFAGGAYSMRAWGARQLGLGSSLLSDTSTSFRDRYGDIQLEMNYEYRFPVGVIGGVKVNSALFVDMGNIWNYKVDVNNPNSKLTFNRLWHDAAIAAGVGLLRLDFDYFLIRLDFAYKVKDPARLANNGWMSIKDFEWRNKEFVVKDANGRTLKRNNYSIQLGINLPF